ncbi:hypothetical protein ACP70R_035135 [Stipagrostis hirtigluma subsp. patula]
MVYCPHCDIDSSVQDPDTRIICCDECGKILDDVNFAEEPTYYKDPAGNCYRNGENFKFETGYSTSYERTLLRGRNEIKEIVYSLHVGGGDTIIDMAHRFYTLAIDRNFTRGRRVAHVAAACLYIACRQSEKPYLLIDFSDYLQISVYALGAVFLQLCQVLLLSDHPIFQKLIDPSLFIRRFTECLLGKRDNDVSDLAVQIVASMKRDWMQTGRKPSGICGAALYIAALSYKYDCTKADVVSVVHVCEATLTKRLIEFENTDSGRLTIEELENDVGCPDDPVSKRSTVFGEILCKHKDEEAVKHFAHGLCQECYDEFTKLTGGLEGGADPPAFQRAEKKRLDAAKRAEEAAATKEAAMGDPFCDARDSDIESTIRTPSKDKSGYICSTVTSQEVTNDSVPSKDPEGGGENGKGDLYSESLSDIDDVEVEGYLHNEEETQYKKVIWEEMNKEYLEEQAAKEALAAELAARGLGVEDGKKKKRRHNKDANSSTPPETPAEATCHMLKRKRFGSKINVEAVGRLYDTKDEGGNANKNEDTTADVEYEEDIGDGETFDHDYDYADHNYDGYVNDGGGAYTDFDDFDF